MATVTCPACGGAGGGPFGRAGSAWDTEDYVCPRCEGRGAITLVDAQPGTRPGIVKANETPAPAVRRARGDRSS